MSIKGKACITGVYEHPTRKAADKSVFQLHAEVAQGALQDAGLSMRDVDGYFCAGDAAGLGAINMVDYLGLKVRHVDSTETGGSSYVVHSCARGPRIGGEPRGNEELAGFAHRLLGLRLLSQRQRHYHDA